MRRVLTLVAKTHISLTNASSRATAYAQRPAIALAKKCRQIKIVPNDHHDHIGLRSKEGIYMCCVPQHWSLFSGFGKNDCTWYIVAVCCLVALQVCTRRL